MTDSLANTWQQAMLSTVQGYRRIIDAAVAQLTDEELHARPQPELNSVAVILRHLGGNLQSRWTDFLTTDGEKDTRDRELEFADWTGSRESLLEYFDAGWRCLEAALRSIDATAMAATLQIRGETLTVPEAVARSVTHIAWHVGQLLMVARMVHQGDWQWQTIAPGASQQHNQRTWGTTAARSGFAADTPKR